jgi:RNA polymerase sigma-70 factor (ECF subfamily)
MDVAVRSARHPLPAWHPVRDGDGHRGAVTAGADEHTALVAQARAGDRGAFEDLVRLHADRLYAVVLRVSGDPHEAEEVVQETFLRAWRNIRRFQGRSQFFTWLYRIGVNEARRSQERRRTRPQSAPLADAETQVPDERQAPAARAEAHELQRALEAAILALPLDYRMALVLRDVEGLSTEQAAAVMELGEAAFKSRLHRARLTVRTAVEDLVAQEDDQ